jgi:hypothetical protein
MCGTKVQPRSNCCRARQAPPTIPVDISVPAISAYRPKRAYRPCLFVMMGRLRSPIPHRAFRVVASRLHPPNPTKVVASSTDLRSDTTAFAGKLSSGQPSAMLFMIT